MNLAQQRDDFIASIQAAGRSPSTVDSYFTRVNTLINHLTENFYPLQQAADIQPRHIQAYHDMLIDKQRSIATRQAYMATTCVFLKYCQRHSAEKQPPDNWIDRIEIPKRTHRLPPTPLSIDQVRELIAANPSTRDRAILTLMYACGLRRSEVVALNVQDLFTTRQQLLVHGKGAKDRIVPIATAALDKINTYLQTRTPSPAPSDPLFATASPKGPRRLTPHYLATLFRRMPNPTGRHIHPHLLRHTFAVHLLRGGADVRHVQALLGHNSPDTTNQYLGLVKDEIKQAYDRALRKILRPTATTTPNKRAA